jgi:raffinose/stachyose/melibiose transport system permease protein
MGLYRTREFLILYYVAGAIPLSVILLAQYMRAIPKELEEAASIDGASRLGFFFRMVIPLSVPGVVTVGILAFIASWNSYILPLFILNNEAAYTLPLGVQAFASQYAVDTSKVLAFTSLSMIPALVFFSLFERRIVGGLTGAVKG